MGGTIDLNTEECLICKAPLEYLTQDKVMECAICHKQERSKTHCANGHYVCSDCHTQGMDSIFGLCLSTESTDPVAIVRQMMDLPFCHMHGPEHHVMVGAALLTAYKNAGGALDLENALHEMYSRGKAVPGGACGFWGACGAGIGTGQFLAIATESTPLAQAPWGLSNQMTSRALESIGKAGGPRCCKRDSFLAILSAVDFVREHLGVAMKRTVPVCTYSSRNSQCIGKKCPFSAANCKKPKVAFLCVHNSCRSQIAEALGKRLAGDVFDSFSAGTAPGTQINPDAVRLMKQVYGIDMEQTQYNKFLSDLPAVDIVVTMGCNVQCPTLPCSHREDWGLDDPSGKEDRAFLAVMAQIEEKVLDLKHRIQSGALE
jgi:protein-tyrosine-phosphatase